MHAITQADLDATQCSHAGCDHSEDHELYLHSRCHLGSGLDVKYDKNTGLLHLYCHECDEEVVAIKLGA